MRWLLIGILFVGLWGFSALHAQQSLRLDDCRRLAREHVSGPRQKELFQKAEASRDALLKKMIRPELWGYGLVSYQNEVPNPASALEYAIDFRPVSKDQYKAGLFYSQRIYDGGEYKARKELSAHETRLAVSQTDASLYRLDGVIDELFVNVLLAEKGVEVLALQAELLQKQLSDCKALFAEGKAYAKEVLEVEAAMLEVDAQRAAFVAENSKCRNVLSELCGVPIDTSTLLMQPLFEGLPGRMVDPAFETLEAMSGQNAIALKQAKSVVMPKAYLFGTAGYGKTGFDLFDNRPDWYAGGGLFVKMPLTAWLDFRHEKELISLKAESLRNRRSDMEKQQRGLEVELEGEAMKYAEMVSHYSQIIEKRVEIRRQQEAMFALGRGTVTDCLATIKAEAEARLQREIHALEQIRVLLQRDHILVQLPTLSEE